MNQDNQQKRRDEFITNKIMAVFLASFVGLLLLIIFEKYISRAASYYSAKTALIVFTCICAAVSIACLVILISRRKKSAGDPYKVFSLRNILIAVAFLTLCGLFLMLCSDKLIAVKYLYIVIPATSVLYLIFRVYTPDFFVHSLVCVLSAICVWRMNEAVSLGTSPMPAFIASLVIAAAAAAVSVFIYSRRKDTGKNSSAKPRKNGLVLLLFTCALMAVLSFVAFRATAVAGYMIIAIIAYFILLAVYFTATLI